MRTALLITIISGIAFLIIGLFTLIWGKESAFYLLIICLSFFAFGMTGGTVNEAKKRLIEKKRFFASLLITVIFLSILIGIERAFYLIFIWLFIMTFWIAGGILYEERKKLLEKPIFCPRCNQVIPRNASFCPNCNFGYRQFIVKLQLKHLY